MGCNLTKWVDLGNVDGNENELLWSWECRPSSTWFVAFRITKLLVAAFYDRIQLSEEACFWLTRLVMLLLFFWRLPLLGLCRYLLFLPFLMPAYILYTAAHADSRQDLYHAHDLLFWTSILVSLWVWYLQSLLSFRKFSAWINPTRCVHAYDGYRLPS